MVLRACCGLMLIVMGTGQCRAEESNRDSDAESPQTTQVRRRFDREKLQNLRQQFSDSKSALSNLTRMKWKVGDAEREALVYVPASTDGKLPLVFVFHGHGGRSEYAGRKLPIHEFWPQAICVYPQGLPTPVPIIDRQGRFNGWQKSIGDQDDRDLKFFDVMLTSLTSEHSIDPKRIYSTGHSNGGYFTYLLWAARGDQLAAVAPIAAGLDLKDFKLQKPKPILHVAGEHDPIVPFRLQELSIAQDKKLNGCDTDGKPAGENCTEFRSAIGTPVVTFIHSGGHEIPAGAPKRIVEFFQQHLLK